MPTVAEAFAQAVQHLQAGRLSEADALLRAVIQAAPQEPEPYRMLGLLAYMAGQPATAETWLRQALARHPQPPAVYFTDLALICQALSHWAEAEAACRQALVIDPTSADSHYSLGNVLHLCQRWTEAESAFRQALALRANFPEAQNNLAATLQAQGRGEDAEAAYRQALALDPAAPYGHYNLGIALRGLGRWDEAEAAYRQALALQPDFPEASNNLSELLRAQDRLSAAEDVSRQALALRPELAEIHVNLASALQGQGRLDEALAHCQQALSLRPGLESAHSSILKYAQHRPGVTRAQLAELHAEWDHRHAAPLRSSWRPFANRPDPDRRLRLGFVSADFGCHPVGYFLVRTLESLDRGQFEVICYCNRRGGDSMTQRLRTAANLWREVWRLADDDLAERIRSDGIDLLIDLSGHTAGNRLLVFARKPAPVQLSWMGYVGTTGLKAIDYLIADRFHVPVGTEKDYAEQVLRLPDGYVCFDPPVEAPATGPVPSLQLNRVTFGSFNNPMKVTTEVVAVWAEILKLLPSSRLVLHYLGLDDSATAQRFRELFAAQGIEPTRLELRGRAERAGLLARYNEVDVALDPFPYSGGLTTCEALWMGVPVVTWPRETFASRHSLSHLSNVGITETIANSREEYVACAVALAQDVHRLAELRATLRERMASSPLCDAPRFAANLQAALRDAWRRWCLGAVIVQHQEAPPNNDKPPEAGSS